MPDKQDTISVIIPAWNAAQMIGRAVDSVLSQSRRADEVIVINDGSTDDTRRMLESYEDWIRVIHQDNAGASAARNAGIRAATGRWIAFLDGDDEWLADHLERSMDLLCRYPGLGWVTGNYYRCLCEPRHVKTPDLDGNLLGRARSSLEGEEVFDSYFSAHQHRAMGCTDTMVIRRELLIEAGLFWEGQKRMNDVDMWLRVAYLNQRIGYVFEPGAIYHMGVPGSILKQHRDARHIEAFLDRHLELSRQAGMSEVFKPCAAAMLGTWIQTLLESLKTAEVRHLLGRFGFLFDPYCRITTYIRTRLPKLSLRYERWKRAVKESRSL